MVRPFVMRGRRGATHGGREGAVIATGLQAVVSFCICSLFYPDVGDDRFSGCLGQGGQMGSILCGCLFQIQYLVFINSYVELVAI
jgi:hypothetical protein